MYLFIERLCGRFSQSEGQEAGVGSGPPEPPPKKINKHQTFTTLIIECRLYLLEPLALLALAVPLPLRLA